MHCEQRNETVNLWWMCNAFAYLVAAGFSHRPQPALCDFGARSLRFMLPLSLLLPCNLLFTKGWLIDESVGRFLCDIFVCLPTAVWFGGHWIHGAGNRHQSHGTVRPWPLWLGSVCLQVHRCAFRDDKLWPLYVALVGGAAMLTGVAFVLARARRVERYAVPAGDLAPRSGRMSSDARSGSWLFRALKRIRMRVTVEPSAVIRYRK